MTPEREKALEALVNEVRLARPFLGTGPVARGLLNALAAVDAQPLSPEAAP